MGGDFFLHRDCRFVQIGFYLHRVRRPPARSGDGKNLDGCDSARVFGTQRSRIRGDWILSTQRLSIHWSLRDSLGDDIAFFHPRCKQNFVVVFVSFFLELESIGTRKFKIVKMRGIYPRCKQNFVVVFVSFFLELESIETRNFKIVKIRGIYPRCNEISSSFSCRFFLS